jgi:hypothetical protein
MASQGIPCTLTERGVSFTLPLRKAKQEPQSSSQDLKDENGTTAEPGETKKLGEILKEKIASRADADDNKEAKRLYETKFIPWITEQASLDGKRPGESFVLTLKDLDLSKPPRNEVLRLIRKKALADGITVSDESWPGELSMRGGIAVYLAVFAPRNSDGDKM